MMEMYTLNMFAIFVFLVDLEKILIHKMGIETIMSEMISDSNKFKQLSTHNFIQVLQLQTEKGSLTDHVTRLNLLFIMPFQ